MLIDKFHVFLCLFSPHFFPVQTHVNIETIGSLSQSTRPCPIKYKSMKAQHQQVKLDRRQTLTEFIKEGQVNLKLKIPHY
jgi:hypothetical protein